MKGRLPKPTTIQIAAGDPSKLGKRKLQEKLESEPAATCGLPDCPGHLKGRARQVWTFWAEELAVMNLDRKPDAQMLEGACSAYDRAVEADIEVNDRGITIEEPLVNKLGDVVGYKIKKNPAVDVSNAAWRQVRAFCSEFGFSPVSRTRLAVEKRDESTADLMVALSQPREPRPAVN